MSRGYAVLLAALMLIAFFALALASALAVRADGFTVGPGIQAAMNALGATPATDEVWLPPDFSLARAFDTEGRVYIYTHADGVTVYDHDDHLVTLPEPAGAAAEGDACALGRAFARLYGGNPDEVAVTLKWESGCRLYPPCGDGGASCGPGQIQRAFFAGFMRAFGGHPDFADHTYADIIADPVFNVRVTAYAIARGWGPHWSGWWLGWKGQRPPWW